MNKRLLILAASLYQVPVILKARDLGYRVLTTDNRPDNPGHALAHESHAVDTTDTPGILALARKAGVSGLMAPATDVAVISAATAASALGLPGPPPEAARLLTGKDSFRDFLRANGWPAPAGQAISGPVRPPSLPPDPGPWIIKPNRASGSKGVFIINDQADFRRRAPESLALSLDGRAVVERFIGGSQHTLEGFWVNGRLALALVTDRLTAPPPHTATWGHLFPSRLEEAGRARVLDLLGRVAGKLGLLDGPFDCDFVWDGREAFLLEMSPRLGGNALARLGEAVWGVDWTAAAIAQATGEPVDLRPARGAPRPAAALLLGLDRAGRAVWDEEEEKRLRREAWVAHLALDVPPGTWAEPFTDGRRRLGEALVTASDRPGLEARLEEFRARLKLTAA
jgi:biotin carboxylase